MTTRRTTCLTTRSARATITIPQSILIRPTCARTTRTVLLTTRTTGRTRACKTRLKVSTTAWTPRYQLVSIRQMQWMELLSMPMRSLTMEKMLSVIEALYKIAQGGRSSTGIRTVMKYKQIVLSFRLKRKSRSKHKMIEELNAWEEAVDSEFDVLIRHLKSTNILQMDWLAISISKSI